MVAIKNSLFQRIHILGASGSGTTSLAAALCETLAYRHFDADDYYWKTKFSEPWPRDLRLQSLRDALDKEKQWILSGAVISWGNPLIPFFDLVVFLSVPHEIRINRLKEREKQRYGKSIAPGQKKHKDYEQFIAWASRYETGGHDVRSRTQQEAWLQGVTCPVLNISGNSPLCKNAETVLDFMRSRRSP